jgi:hypothetical protein
MEAGDWLALTAIVVAIASTITTVLLWAKSEQRSNADALKRDQLEAEVTELRRTQNDILTQVADTMKLTVDPVERNRLGASVTIAVRRGLLTQSRGQQYAVTIKNLGPGTARVTGLQLLPNADQTVSAFPPMGEVPLPGGVVELLPGEDYLVHFGTSTWPAEFAVRWTDATGTRERERSFRLPLD